MKRYIQKALLVIFILVLLTGCKKNNQNENGRVYNIYTVNKEETKVTSYELVVDEPEDKVVDLLIEQLKKAPDFARDKAAIMDSVEIIDYKLENKRLVINFSKEYLEYSMTGEVLSRAAIVRTLCQSSKVEFVSFLVEGAELTNSNGIQIGLMNADTFVENNGSEINAYERTVLKLYYADESGQKLRVCEKEVLYNSNISMEKLVMEQLIKGPDKEGYSKTVNPDTNVLSVTVKDGTCYVNLDANFLTTVENVSPEVVVYSVVNSLSELTNVYSVQISIDGETDVSLLETIPLSGSFERNYELVEK